MIVLIDTFKIHVFLLIAVIIHFARGSFFVEYEWTHVNFTWESVSQYSQAVQQSKYIAQNAIITQIKIYEDKVFVPLAKFSQGIPVTLTYFYKDVENKFNIPLTPYPSWKANDDADCTNLQSVHTIEIDTDGVLWAADGARTYGNQNCPCKLVFLDLTNNGKIIHVYTFPDNVASRNGASLKGLVIDEANGGYAYISDINSDSGLIVYSREQNRSWKLKHSSMYAELIPPIYKVGNELIWEKFNLDGIALSPITDSTSNERTLYYSPLSGYNLYSISTTVLRNETLCSTWLWQKKINFVGRKPGPSDGLIIDDKGNLYYTILSQNAIGKWNINTPFYPTQTIFEDNQKLIWPDTLSIDSVEGDLYVVSSHFELFIRHKMLDADQTRFRIWKHHNGRKSYLCTGSRVAVKQSSLCAEPEPDFQINDLQCRTFGSHSVKCN